MLAVALETSVRPASVAVGGVEHVREAFLQGDRAHASDLLPVLDRLLRELRAEPGDVRAVFVGTGPGSYTGLRVGIATALGLARGCGAHLVGVPSGETLAYGELAPGEECVVLIDARREELYCARYRRTADDVAVVLAPCALRAREADLPAGVPIFADPGAAAGLAAEHRARVRGDVLPRAGALLALGRLRLERRGPQDPEGVEPLYLRRFAPKERAQG